jgi:hypothetical protein
MNRLIKEILQICEDKHTWDGRMIGEHIRQRYEIKHEPHQDLEHQISQDEYVLSWYKEYVANKYSEKEYKLYAEPYILRLQNKLVILQNRLIDKNSTRMREKLNGKNQSK